MAKYDGWTLGETEALLNIVGGVDAARETLRGERKLTNEKVMRPSHPAALPPLVGTVVKTLRLKPNKVSSVAEAIQLGNYDGHDGAIVQLFADDEAGLAEAVNVDLVQFDRDPLYDEMLAWAEANNNRAPILPKHIYAIGKQYPKDQRVAPIVGLGSVRGGHVLYLYGYSRWRRLCRSMVEGGWGRDCLFGFLSK